MVLDVDWFHVKLFSACYIQQYMLGCAKMAWYEFIHCTKLIDLILLLK